MNILVMSSIRVTSIPARTRTLTLPGVLAALARDEVEAFTALRPFQRHAWHSFLVQLATFALLRSGLRDMPTGEADWSSLLRNLTPEYPGDEPWSLVAPPDRPALLQPPVPILAELRNAVTTPDALDMLVTSRNHDLKSEVMVGARPDDWLFALVSLQTMEGFLGAGNFGASRMNGGFANRPGVGIAPGEDALTDGTPGRHFRRDITRLLALRPQAEKADYAARGGLGLTWLRPWDGTRSIRRSELDPYYIDVCRRVRLVEVGGRLRAQAGTSKVPRIEPTPGGSTGDPWAPTVTDKNGDKLFTPDAGGFGYRRMVELMFGGGRYIASPLQIVADDTDPEVGLAVLARALVRGQGKTEGYHERRVPLSRRVGTRLRMRDAEPVARAAQERVKIVGEMQNRVLKPALLALFENGPDAIDFRDDGANRRAAIYLAWFDRQIDRDFFPALWREFEEETDDGAERRAWVWRLLASARSLVNEADAGGSKAVRRRFRARARAEAVLQGAPRRNPDLRNFFEDHHS